MISKKLLNEISSTDYGGGAMPKYIEYDRIPNLRKSFYEELPEAFTAQDAIRFGLNRGMKYALIINVIKKFHRKGIVQRVIDRETKSAFYVKQIVGWDNPELQLNGDASSFFFYQVLFHALPYSFSHKQAVNEGKALSMSEYQVEKSLSIMKSFNWVESKGSMYLKKQLNEH